jgi:hypothetical protein
MKCHGLLLNNLVIPAFPTWDGLGWTSATS